MNIKDMNDAIKANKIIENIDKAMNALISAANVDVRPDCGGIKGWAEYGYHINISDHRDGSGNRIDMSGCYIAQEVREAVKEVLIAKRAKMVEFLNSIGVSTND